MSTTRVGTRAAPANPASPWPASITSAVGLSTMVTIATRKRPTAAWKKTFEPKRWPSLAPSMMNPETPSEYNTTAVPTVVGGVLKLSTMPPIDTGMAATLKDISIWPMAMTIMGTHESRTSASAPAGETAAVAMTSGPPHAGPKRERGGPLARASGEAAVAVRYLLHFRLRDEPVHPPPPGQELGHELPLDAVAGLVERRGERPQAAFTGRDGDDPAADAALARQPDVVQPVAGGLVQPGGRHHRQRVVADGRIDHPLLGERVHAAVGQGRAHHRQVPGADVQRALPRVQVGRLGRVHVDPAEALQQAGDALVAVVGLGRGGVHLVVERQPAAGEARQAVVNEPPLGVERPTRHQAGGGDRPRIHHRVRPAVRALFDSRQRVERQPGGVHADLLADLFGAQGLTDQGEDERLGDAHDREFVVRVPDRVDRAF